MIPGHLKPTANSTTLTDVILSPTGQRCCRAARGVIQHKIGVAGA